MGTWTGLICLRIEQVADSWECGKEISGSMKYGEFF
jgi:hypothetical protein